MTSVLPPHLTADAIPEGRTPDEQHAPTPGQAEEFLRTLENENCQAESPTAPVPETTKKPAEPDATRKEKKTSSKPKKKQTSSPKITNNITNICNSHGVTYGTNITTYNFVMGSPKDFLDVQRGPRPNSQQHDQPLVSEKLLNSLNIVTKEDCTIMSEYIKSDWKDLGTFLFNQLTVLDDYLVEVERKSKREAVQWTLNKWREVAGKNAKVGRLARVLGQLKEHKALEKLSQRHLK